MQCRSWLLLIFALLHAVLVGITRYPTVCLICARKRSRISAIVLVLSADPEKKNAVSRASYYASLEK